MYHSEEVKAKAIKLRKTGLSMEVIARILGIAKSTSSLWLRNVELSEKAKIRLRVSSQKGREKGINNSRIKRLEIYSTISQSVRTNLHNYILDIETKRLLCAFLYWGEGGKTKNAFRFSNSDPSMVSIFLELLRQGFKIDEQKFRDRVHLHEYHDMGAQLQFWSNITKIPMERMSTYLKPHTGKNKRLGYPGCININYFDVRLFIEATAYYKIFCQIHGGVV